MNFTVFPPEINSARLFAGGGLGPMLAAAAAWDGLAADLQTAAASFSSLTAGLAAGAWQGPASVAMTNAAAPYVTWLSTSGAQAEHTASQARIAAATFEAAQSAAVHPALVTANRTGLLSLVASNLFGQNTPAIAAAEAEYEQMWAQDVAAMAGYRAAAAAIAAQLPSWSQLVLGLQDRVDNVIARLGLPGNNLGVGNTGVFNIGTLNTGSYSWGLGNTGLHDFGIGNTGNGNIGVGNTGNNNIGVGNSGNNNIGVGNSGNYNTGFVNIGTGMFGIGNPGNGNVGILIAHQNQVGQGGVDGVQNTVLIMGGTGLSPLPSLQFISNIERLYISPNYAGYTAQFLVTPEKLFPFTGLHSISFDASVTAGVQDLNTQIMANIAAGNHVTVVGVSQSATIATLEQRYLLTLPADQRPALDQLSFILLGNPDNPNGGFLSRFAGEVIKQVGFTFYGATPADAYPTTNYTIEYDGVADFPQYPLNLFADANAVAGMLFLHPTYSSLTAAQISSGIVLPVSSADTQTTYIMIPTENLPLLTPLRWIPFIGNPLAALIQPDLKVLVNLGYGNIDYGWSQGPADVETPFGWVPNVPAADVIAALQQGAVQGVHDAAVAAGFPPPAPLRW